MILLHGGMGNARNFGSPGAGARRRGYRAIAIDSRGQGRSTRDDQPFSYDSHGIATRSGRDGRPRHRAGCNRRLERRRCTGLALARAAPERVAGVFFFACNVDPERHKTLRL